MIAADFQIDPSCFVAGDPDEGAPPKFRVVDAPPPYVAPVDPLAITAETIAKGAGEDSTTDIVRGFLAFPTQPPPEDVLAGDAQFRVTDQHFFNAPAGEGKSVGMGGISIAWPLGLPYFGIHPSRPLKVLHFCGEDDYSTLGQIREGFLQHSEEITGRKLTADDLASLDRMVRTDFSRGFVGDAFLMRLDEMLTEERADIIIINPLLSFIGGPIVECVSKFLREGLDPILKRHQCAALIAHHTCKLSRDSWANMDFTYSGIGGGEVANVPRSIFTLAPTGVDGLRLLHVSKRKTVGWKDGEGSFTDHFFVKRSDDPKRPAWLPVSHAEAAELIAGAKSSGGIRVKKASVDHVLEILATGAMTRQALLEALMRTCGCGMSTAKTVISNAQLGGVATFTEKDTNTGRRVLFFCLPEHRGQWVKDELTT